MYTIVILTKRKPDVTAEQFYQHYRTTHFELASALPDLISYQQAHVLHGDESWTTPEAFPEYDALSQYTFESVDTARASFASPAGQLVDADTSEFIEWPSVLFFPVTTTQRFERAEPTDALR